MADDEFITLDDDDLEESSHDLSELSKPTHVEKEGSKLLYYIIIAILVILIALFAFIIIKKLNQPNEIDDVNTSKIIQNIQEKKLSPKEENEVQKLLSKADRLYKNGHKEEALTIFKDLSQYNKALSFYNIGVAKLKEAAFKESISNFEKAMQSDKLTCASALNICTAALSIGDEKTFVHYLKIAKKYLPFMINEPLYSYYYTLVHYYDKEPFETIISTKHPTSTFYQNEQNFIAGKTLALFNSDATAINFIHKIPDMESALTVGLMQARIKEYNLAEQSLQLAINQGFEPLKSNIALALVKNRLGAMQDCGTILKTTYDAYKEKAENTYPIEVILKKSLFDPIAAQKAFKKSLLANNIYRFSLLFYYAPYHVIDASATSKYITKGAKKIQIQSINPALSYLSDSTAISESNLAITKALRKLLENKLYDANEIFKEAISLYPANATMHFDLALSYAQIFNFQQAYKHFSKSYSLDSHNHMALAFKTFCAVLLHKDIPKNDLEKVRRETNDTTVLALLDLAEGNLGLNIDYLKDNNDTFKNMINLILAYNRDDLSYYQQSAKHLNNILPTDIVSNILNIDATHNTKNIKAYANAIQKKLTLNKLDLTPLYLGAVLPKELYIRMMHIAGISKNFKKNFQSYIKERKPTISLQQTLAFSALYTNDFEEAYKLYNTLIDDYNQKDSHTLFLAAIAAIGSKHHANAVALLELSKLTDASNFESRYALGLLYQEAKNLEGASIEYKKIGNSSFKSDYFSFKLKK